MHYSINGYIVPTELSALPIERINKKAINLIDKTIKKYNYVRILDYGCGKLRHSFHLVQKNFNVCGVDSIWQINRSQIILNEKTTLKEFSNKYSNLKIQTIEEFSNECINYEFALCTNVLSTIPYDKEVIYLLQNIYNHLITNGRLLISVQYKNSYFDNYKIKNNAFKFNNGWLIRNKNKNSYYRIIKPEMLKKWCLYSRFILEKEIQSNGSIYLILKK